LIRIQPDEGLALTTAAKVPGPDLRLGVVKLDFQYGQVFGGQTPEAYERLLLDAIHGDATLYALGDWVDQAWGYIDQVLPRCSAAGLATPRVGPRRTRRGRGGPYKPTRPSRATATRGAPRDAGLSARRGRGGPTLLGRGRGRGQRARGRQLHVGVVPALPQP